MSIIDHPNYNNILLLVESANNNHSLWEKSRDYLLHIISDNDKDVRWHGGYQALMKNKIHHTFNNIRDGFNRYNSCIFAEYTLMGLMRYNHEECAHLFDSGLDELLLLNSLGEERAFYFTPYAHVQKLLKAQEW